MKDKIRLLRKYVRLMNRDDVSVLSNILNTDIALMFIKDVNVREIRGSNNHS